MSKMEQIGKNEVKLTITVAAATFEEGMQKAYRQSVKRYSVPGFRKGHAPRKVIENFYGEGIFYEDAFNAVAPEAVDAAIEEHKLEVVSRLSVDIEQIGEGQDLVFSATVFTKPEVSLGEYKGISVAKPAYNVSDEEVDADLARTREQRARYVDVEDRPCKDGDTVNIDYSGSIDGVQFPGGTAEKQDLVLGSGRFIPGFEEQVVGMQIGEDRDIKVTFPEEYHAEELKGKEATFAVHLHGIKEKQLPDLDDEFAKDVSEFDTLDEYKASVKERLTENAKRQADNELENSLVEKVCENAEVEIPEPMVDRQLDYMIQEMEFRMSYQGLKLEDYFKYTGMTMDDLRQQNREEAQKRVKAQLVLEALQKQENIEATDEDLDQEIAERAEKMKKPVEEYKEKISQGERDYMREQIVIRKTLELLKDNCVYTEEAPKAEEKAEGENA